MSGMRGNTAIAGIGETDYTVTTGRNRLDLALEAILACAADDDRAVRKVMAATIQP